MSEKNIQEIQDAAAMKLDKEREGALVKARLEEKCRAKLKELKINSTNPMVLGSFVKMREGMINEVVRMLTRFIYQNEEFAAEVVKCQRTIDDAVDIILKDISADAPQLSDVEAFAAAVRFYIPSAQVTVSFRLNIPCELDDDLVGLGDDMIGGDSMILDLFEVGE